MEYGADGQRRYDVHVEHEDALARLEARVALAEEDAEPLVFVLEAELPHAVDLLGLRKRTVARKTVLEEVEISRKVAEISQDSLSVNTVSQSLDVLKYCVSQNTLVFP